MKKGFFFLMGMLCSFLGVMGQDRAAKGLLKPLNIGDTLPNISLEKMVNYKTPKARTGDFRGKVLIIDFWATWCGPCVNAMPKLNELQKKLGDKLSILPVSSQQNFLVQGFLNRKGFSLPSVAEDSVLKQLFPSSSIPHVVLVNEKGIVKAITHSTFITEENMLLFLAGAPVTFPPKNNVKYDSKQPILSQDLGVSPLNSLYQSTITAFIPGVSGSSNISGKFNGKSVMSHMNLPLCNLIVQSFGKPLYFASTRVLYQNVKDSERYMVKSGKTEEEVFNWGLKNLYCYELITSENVPIDTKKKIMVDDLGRFIYALYGAKATIEKRRVNCFELVRCGPVTPYVQVRNGNLSMILDAKSENCIYSNILLSELAEKLEASIHYFPIVANDTMKSKLNLTLPVEIFSGQSPELKHQKLVKELNKVGYNLIATQAEIEVVVISEQ